MDNEAGMTGDICQLLASFATLSSFIASCATLFSFFGAKSVFVEKRDKIGKIYMI